MWSGRTHPGVYLKSGRTHPGYVLQEGVLVCGVEELLFADAQHHGLVIVLKLHHLQVGLGQRLQVFGQVLPDNQIGIDQTIELCASAYIINRQWNRPQTSETV